MRMLWVFDADKQSLYIPHNKPVREDKSTVIAYLPKVLRGPQVTEPICTPNQERCTPKYLPFCI